MSRLAFLHGVRLFADTSLDDLIAVDHAMGAETYLAGEPIISRLTRAPGNNAAIGGLKVVAANGWFAARPSGTENIYKIYAESFKDETHLKAVVQEARAMVDSALGE